MSSQIEEVGIRLRADGVVELSNGMSLSAAAVDKLGRAADAARKPLDGLAVGAAAATGHAQALSPQIGSLISQLATGAPALANAAANGDAFGAALYGMGPAMRTVVAAGTPLIGVLGTSAAALGLLVLAYSQGKGEQDGFARSMVMTGNAAGTTMSQMVAMAQGMDQVRGTQGEASDALAQLAGTAQVAGHNLQKFGELAIQMEQVTGQSVEQTVKTFAELGRSPLQASVKLNEGTNYLTRSLYDQIKALEKQGRAAEAASVAQNAWADVMKKRTDELETRLGAIERAWAGIKSVAKEAWDAMLGIGRQKTLQEQLAAAEKALAEMPEPRRGTNPLQGQQRREAMRQHIADLRMQIYMEGEVAAAESSSAEATKRYIAEQEKKVKGASAADKALAERIALFQKIYGGVSNEQLRQDDFRRSELGDTTATNTAMRTAAEQAEAAIQKARESSATAAERSAQALEREAATLADHTAEIGLNEGALLARRQAQLDVQIGEAATLLSVIEGAAGYERQTEALQRQIAALERMKGLQGEAAFKNSNEAWRKDNEQRAVAEAAENRRRTEGLANSIEEGLMNGFRNGGSLADIFLNELKAQFARTVLRPMIEPIAAGLGGGGSGMGGLFSAAMSLFSGDGVPIDEVFLQTELPMAGFDWVGEYRHGGGVGGADRPAFTRSLPAATWAGAPRFHTGIGPDEVPAVLQRTEGVFTQGQMKAMAPVSDLAKVGGNRITFAPTISIDSRTDRAEVGALVQSAMRQSQAELLEMMDRRMA